MWYLFRDHGQIDVLYFEIYFHPKSVAYLKKYGRLKSYPTYFNKLRVLCENLFDWCGGNTQIYKVNVLECLDTVF